MTLPSVVTDDVHSPKKLRQLKLQGLNLRLITVLWISQRKITLSWVTSIRLVLQGNQMKPKVNAQEVKSLQAARAPKRNNRKKPKQ